MAAAASSMATSVGSAGKGAGSALGGTGSLLSGVGSILTGSAMLSFSKTEANRLKFEQEQYNNVTKSMKQHGIPMFLQGVGMEGVTNYGQLQIHGRGAAFNFYGGTGISSTAAQIAGFSHFRR